jgi:hypothetical protein
MKKVITISLLMLCFGLFGIAQETLSFRFARPQVISGTPDKFQFDVEIMASAAGTYQRDLQIYFDYNTTAFGSDIFANAKITVIPLTLMQNFYVVVNAADNTTSKFAVITEASNEMTQPGSATYFNVVPTTFTGFLRFQIAIANSNVLAGISFDQALMNGGQYKQSTSNTNPIAYANPSLYMNNLSNASLKGLLFSSVKFYLQGPYNTGTPGLMNTNLLTLGYLPLGQPYKPTLPYYGNPSPKWYYTGTESVVSFPANTVDWVIVQLRDATAAANALPGTIVATKPAFLKNNGDLVGLDGNPLIIKQAYANNLYVVIYHRNHLGIMSSNGVGINATGTYEYNYSDAITKVYGGGSGYKLLQTGYYGMVAADGNGNGVIQNTDETAVWKVDLNLSGYKGGDFNMNGVTQNTDETSYWKPNLNVGGQIPGGKSSENPYASQIPE